MRANALSMPTATRCRSANFYHAGEDWFKFDARRQVDAGAADGEPVQAVANGLVSWKQNIGAEGWVIAIEHLLADGSKVWSAYWHVADPTVSIGQLVYRGDVIGKWPIAARIRICTGRFARGAMDRISFRRQARAGAARAMAACRR